MAFLVEQTTRMVALCSTTHAQGLPPAVWQSPTRLWDFSALTRNLEHEPIHPTGVMFEWFVQDSWKVKPNLRLEFGLRHSIIQPYYSLWRNMIVFDPKFYDPSKTVTQDPATGFIVGTTGDRYNGLVIPGDGFPDSAKGRFPIATSGEFDYLFRGVSKEYSKIQKRDF